ncbi:ubiquitin fusion degradation protein UFD1 [Elsinoe australis]|uniref:Ubiquitin fusion degradation protein 1 n=1 Tax=Elsinoe australis TaxID=40998 RepID=A0A4U7B3S3_9PEZI|nr:ubiquitin fusion degradation protein UFD1 [Elsinoe australis]
MYRSPFDTGNDPYGDPFSTYQRAMHSRGRPRRFDEYYRTYPVAMLPGPDRSHTNHGGKIFLPASALDKLTTLHITYPMLFELINGAKGKKTHSGVLEFIAEEGRCYLPHWLMTVLDLEPGDLLQVKSTDLPPGSYIKLQPQSTSFLDISDPKAVLETAFRNFSCLTQNDIFTFSYNDTEYAIKVLSLKPDTDSHAISVQETDLSVDFDAPVGYEEEMEKRKAASATGSGTSTPRSAGGRGIGHANVHSAGTMAQAINYSAIAPNSTAAAQGAKNASSLFSGSGNRLVPKKGKGKDAASASASTSAQGSAAASPKPGTPVQNAAAGGEVKIGGAASRQRRNGPQPLRLPPNKLFFGYEIKPVKKKEDGEDGEAGKEKREWGEGQSLRKKK